MWYRVTCDKLEAGKLVQVHSVDLGTVAFLNSANMKKLPVELIFHPIHVYKCILGKLFTIQVAQVPCIYYWFFFRLFQSRY